MSARTTSSISPDESGSPQVGPELSTSSEAKVYSLADPLLTGQPSALLYPESTSTHIPAIPFAPPIVVQKKTGKRPSSPGHQGEAILQKGDYIFIKQNYQFVRIYLSDVIYVEADDKYSTVVTSGRKFVLRLPLSTLLERLTGLTLIRVHRSFAVNLAWVESFSDYQVQVQGQAVPLGRTYRTSFFEHFHNC